MIIDIHTHVFPDKIAGRTIDILENNIKNVQGEIHSAYIPATLGELKSSMARNNIDISVVMPIATTLTQSSSINSFASKLNAEENIISFGSLHPMQKDWEYVLYDIKEKGLPGIKLHPEYQEFFIDSKEALQILKKCEEYGLIVMLHAGNDIGIKPPSHCLPDRLSHTLRYVSGENIIAAHMGGWKAWDDVEKYLVGKPLYFDTSYTMQDIEKEQFLRITKNHTPDKILFGTDSPWSHQSKTADYILSLNIGDAAKEKILYKNAKKLLKIC